MIRLLDLYQAREIPMICQQAQDFLDVAQWQHSLRLSPPPPLVLGLHLERQEVAASAHQQALSSLLTCDLGVILVQRLDGEELILPLVGHHAVYLAAHHQLHILRHLVLTIPAGQV